MEIECSDFELVAKETGWGIKQITVIACDLNEAASYTHPY